MRVNSTQLKGGKRVVCVDNQSCEFLKNISFKGTLKFTFPIGQKFFFETYRYTDI